jgi:hypothetical protein
LPSALEMTPFSQSGDIGFGLMLLLSGLAALAHRVRRS